MLVSFSLRRSAAGILLATTLLSSPVFAQAIQRDNSILAVQRGRPRRMTIGPVAGLTTAWHPAPATTHVPVDSTVQLRQYARRGEQVVWHGAEEILRDGEGSVAVCPGDQPGIYFVRAIVSTDNGARYESSMVINKVLTHARDIVLGTPRIMEEQLALPAAATNGETMEYYFGPSIASVERISSDTYLTSVGRPFRVDVAVDPPGFAPLIEWRTVDGMTWLGASTTAAINDVGTHALTVGGPDAVPALFVETYETVLTSHVSGMDFVGDGQPITFTARTEPAGYEDRITWLSSTKYGSALPVMGHGPSFTVQFDETWGPNPHNPQTPFQWLGARCDNDRFNQDRKTGACCLPNGCLGGITGIECIRLDGAYHGDESSCADVICTVDTGACCAPEGCLDGLEDEMCLALDGIFQGADSSCKNVPCLPPSGACCVTGICFDDTAADSCAGIYFGDDTSCLDEKCLAPVGACCLAAACNEVMVDTCAATGGSYQGDGTACADNPCPDVIGACCTGATCAETTVTDCTALAGTYLGDMTTCTLDSCTEPTGACCVAAACTENVTSAACTATAGVYQGDDVACTEVTCAPAMGVLINEVRIDQPGPDVDEYFELTGAVGTALDGLTYLVVGDGAGGSGVIEVAVALDGLVIGSSGTFLAGEASLTINGAVPDLPLALNFENSDNFTHALVRQFAGAEGDDLDVDDDCVLDIMPWSEMVDLVALVENDDVPPSGTECHYGPPQVGPDGDAVPSHVVRCGSSWRIGDPDPAAGDDTPGALNICP